MSIKDLFSKKTVVIKNAESGSINAESQRFILKKAEKQESFVPPVDFSTASNFVRFGSAETYYGSAVTRLYSEYPYDGSEAEKIIFDLSSSYFDRYILSDLYPKSTGYGILNPSGYGVSSKTNGYGLNASSDDYEYIFIGGGVRPSPINQHDPTLDSPNEKLHKKFDKGTFFEEGTNKTSAFSFNHQSGSTIEFWMKKNSFDKSVTEKEVIFDLWNGYPSSSVSYGRITLELFPDTSDENPFRFTYQNGRVGVFQQSLISDPSFTISNVADGAWHHWAVSTSTRLTDNVAYLDLKLYKDGIVINKQSVQTKSFVGTPQLIGNITGRLDGQIGALLAPVASTNSGELGAKYSGKLSASLDEFRFWKKRVNSQEIYNNWFHPIGGGANTDKYRETLALYYKFNEGITLTSSVDSTVLDYSGRVVNGKWTGYTSHSRNTGSCFVSASVLNHEPLDPIIRFNHPEIRRLSNNLRLSGSLYDVSNTSYMYDMVPFWMREEDLAQGDENLKKMYQIIASYFDTLYLQIEALPDLKAKKYFSPEKKPYPFVQDILKHNGLIVPDLFISQGVLEKFSDRDAENIKFENDMDDLKRRIYYNIYNNLKTIYESKGTEKSYRNLLRCFGIDDEIVKLNLYTDNGINYLTDKVKYSSHKTKFLNHNHPDNFIGRVFNTSSSINNRTFITGSGPHGTKQERNLAFTLEADIIVPKKKKLIDDGYFPTDFLTSSIMGFHSASAHDPDDFSWHGTDVSNLQVHLVRPIQESDDAKFVISDKQNKVLAESQTFKSIYDNQRWALGLKVYPDGYPFIGTVATSSNPTYTAELYGVTHTLNDVEEQFTIKATLSNAVGTAMLCNTKRFYAGCEAVNFTGIAKHPSDIKIAACRLWYDKLDNAVLKQHNLDASNYGHNKIHGNPTPYVKGLENVHIPSAEALAFNWDFEQITKSDGDGRFVVEDFSSGTQADRYGWIDNLILRENRARGFGYGPNSTKIVDNEFIFSAKKELPEISFTSDGVFIKGDEEIYFSEDEDTTDNVFAFEKSMYQVLSEEIFKTFSTVTEYANLFMKPVDLYREEYKRLDHFKELYFERVENDLDFEKFTNYFKFIDSTISAFIQQLHPAMAKFNEGISDMVESHILERPKYQRKFPFLTTRDTTPDGKISGIGERVYPWREGHAPNYREEFDDNDHCFWQKERAEKPRGVNAITGSVKLDELRKVIVSEVDGKSKNLGTSPPYSQYTIVFGDGAGGGGIPAAGEFFTFAFSNVSLLVSFNNGGANETAFGASTSNELKIDIATETTAEAIAGVVKEALKNANAPSSLKLADIPDLTSNSLDRILTLTAAVHGDYGLTFSDNAANIIITNISNTARPAIYQGSTYAVRSFSRQYRLTYAEQKTIHGGTNYGHQKNRDFVLDHLKPHGAISSNHVPQEVITIGAGEGLGVLGLDKCNTFSDPYETEGYSPKHLQKAEYRFVGIVGRYADGTGDMPKSDEVDELFKVKGHRGFPFNLVSGTIATGYNKKIHDRFDDDFILTNLHSDTTTPSNDVPMQGPFAETWVGGRQFRHIPMNRALKTASRSTGTIVLADIPLLDETVTISDGVSTKVFIFKTAAGGYDSANELHIDLDLALPDHILQHFRGKIEAALNIEASAWVELATAPPVKVLTLTNMRSFAVQGLAGNTNVAITNTFSHASSKTTGFIGGSPGLDNQFTRPEGYRLLVGDHPSETIKDGAMGLVGPDYGGPYPDTTRKMAIHYREERAKRPFNIKNIKYTTGSSLLGNYKESYEVVSSVGRMENNFRFREFSDVSSSLRRQIRSVLPMSTNQASLFGGVPFVTGNVFGGNTNITATKRRVKRRKIPGVFASGSLFFDDHAYALGGSLASGSFTISGSTLLSFSTGSFEMSASSLPGEHAQTVFQLLPPTLSVSEGGFNFTGSFIHGKHASGSVTVSSMVDLSKASGQIGVWKPTEFGNVAKGSVTVGSPPTYTVSSGSFDILGPYQNAVSATGGEWTAALGRTTYSNNIYQGSFDFQGPPVAAKEGVVSFTAAGTTGTITDGHNMTIEIGGTTKTIYADTNNSIPSGADNIAYYTRTHTDIKAIRSRDNYPVEGEDASFSGVTQNGVKTISFWFKLNESADDTDTQLQFHHVAGGSNQYMQVYTSDFNSGTGPMPAVRLRTSNGTTKVTKFDQVSWDGTEGWQFLTFVVDQQLSANATVSHKLYVNGQHQQTVTATFGSSPGNMLAPTHFRFQPRNGTSSEGDAIHDVCIWDAELSAAEIEELYNEGAAFDPTTHSAASDLVTWWKLGEESVFSSFDETSTSLGSSAITVTYSGGSVANALLFDAIDTQRGRIELHSQATGTKTNTQIWDGLKADLAAAFPNSDIGYKDYSTYAQFWLVGDDNTPAFSRNSGYTFQGAVTQPNGGVIVGTSEVASTLKDGDTLTIAGYGYSGTITATTTNKDSGALILNTANTYRKALSFWHDTATNLYHTNLGFNWAHGDHIAISGWAQRPSDSSRQVIVEVASSNIYERIIVWVNGGDDFGAYVDWGSGTNAAGQSMANNSLSDIAAGEWFHFLLTFPRTSAQTMKVYVNGIEKTVSYAAMPTPSPLTLPTLTRINIGSYSGGNDDWLQGMQDVAIWNAQLGASDATILYNSGSWFDLNRHPKAHQINHWYLLGNEAGITQAVGDTLADGTAVTSISPAIGKENLTVNNNTLLTVLDGVAETFKSDSTIFSELETMIETNWSHAYGASDVIYSTSGNTATFTLTHSKLSTQPPTAFSVNAQQGFKNETGPSSTGVDYSTANGGTVDETHYIRYGNSSLGQTQVVFYPDVDNSHAGGTYALKSGGPDYWVFTGQSSDSDFYENLEDAVNAAYTTHTTLHAGSGLFYVTANSAGTAGNLDLGESGNTFIVTSDVAGGSNVLNNSNKRGVAFSGATGSLDGSGGRTVYVSTDLSARVTELALGAGSVTFIQDGVWLYSTSGHRRYYVSSTGSTAGSNGSTALWQRVTASLAHGINTATGNPGSFNIVALGSTARIEFTGSYTLSNGHDFSVGAVSEAGYSGPANIGITDSTVNGFGHPTDSDYSTNRTLRLGTTSYGGSVKEFEFVHPHNGYTAGAGNIPIRVTGSQAEIVGMLRGKMEEHVPNYTGFQIGPHDTNVISFTSSMGGLDFNNNVTDNAKIITSIQNTIGGTNEVGAGHHRGIKIENASSAVYLYASQDLASSSAGTLLDSGIHFDGSSTYYISTTGSTGYKTTIPVTDRLDYWNRWVFAVSHAYNTLTGQQPSNIFLGYHNAGTQTPAHYTDTITTLYVTGAFTASGDHNLTYTQVDGPSPAGLVSQTIQYLSNSAGYGRPTNGLFLHDSNNRILMTTDANNSSGGELGRSNFFYQTYPYNSYAILNSSIAINPDYNVKKIRHTGSLTGYISRLKHTMEQALNPSQDGTSYTGFKIDNQTISFTASNAGSSANILFPDATMLGGNGSSTTEDGGNHRGVADRSSLIVQDTGSLNVLKLIASHDLSYHYTGSQFWKDGIWRETANKNYYYISATGSVVGADGNQTEWVRRVSDSLLHGIGTRFASDFYSDSGVSGSFTIVSGTAPHYSHILTYTGFFTSSGNHNLDFNSVGGFSAAQTNSRNFGKLLDPSLNVVQFPQILKFHNGTDGSDPNLQTRIQFTVPHDSGSGPFKGDTGLHVRLTGAVNAGPNSIWQRLSSSFRSLTNYMVSDFMVQGGTNVATFRLKARNVGSGFNSDLSAGAHGTLGLAISHNFQGGHGPYASIDNNYILLSNLADATLGQDPKTHLFKLDHDGANPPGILTSRTHTIPVDSQGSVFSLAGEFVTGSTPHSVPGKNQPDLILVRGSTYRFGQKIAVNGGHPIVFHTSPLTASSAGNIGTIPFVVYNDNLGPTTYSDYASKVGNSADVVAELSIRSHTPDQFYYGCGYHPNMGGRIFVIDYTDSITNVDTNLPNSNAWNNLRDAIKTKFPRLNVSYNVLADNSQINSDTSEHYIPATGRALFKITGSTNTGSLDNTVIVTSGSSWEHFGNIVGATTYGGEGLNQNASFRMAWGQNPYSQLFETLNFGTSKFDKTNPYATVDEQGNQIPNASTDDTKFVILDNIFTGSYVDTDPNSAWFASSSATWDLVSSSIAATGHYDFTRQLSADRKNMKFNIVARYYDERYNYTGSAKDGWKRTMGFSKSPASNFEIIEQPQGAVNPRAPNAPYNLLPSNNSYFEMNTPAKGVVRFVANYKGFRERVSSTNQTIYFDMRVSESTQTSETNDFRSNFIKAFHDLTIEKTDGTSVPMHRLLNYVDANKRFDIVSSVTGSDVNFLNPAALFPNAIGGYSRPFFSGSQANLQQTAFSVDGVDYQNNKIAGSHNVTGGVTFYPTLFFDSRVNINQREQSVLQNGSRQKTVIMSRFYGGGGPEVMTEAFLDVYAKERSVYSALPYRNLLVKNDSGEAARTVGLHQDGHNVLIDLPDSIRVNSHAGRREGLNTLHSRHAGKAGVDSVHGAARGAKTGATMKIELDQGDPTTWGTAVLFSFRHGDVNHLALLGGLPPGITDGQTSGNDDAYTWAPNFEVQIHAGGTGYDWIETSNIGRKHEAAISSTRFPTKKQFIAELARLLATAPTGNLFDHPNPIVPSGQIHWTVSYDDKNNTVTLTSTTNVRTGRSTSQVDFGVGSILSSAISISLTGWKYFDDYQEPSQGGTYEPSYHKVPRNTKVVPRLLSDSDTAVVLVEKRNNFYLQTQIPASDYHYSWVTSSLGDNYNVRSGKQKVFGYWPKDGILVRNIKLGQRGSYYANQVTASTFDSAITFPTGSEIHGS